MRSVVVIGCLPILSTVFRTKVRTSSEAAYSNSEGFRRKSVEWILCMQSSFVSVFLIDKLPVFSHAFNSHLECWAETTATIDKLQSELSRAISANRNETKGYRNGGTRSPGSLVLKDSMRYLNHIEPKSCSSTASS